MYNKKRKEATKYHVGNIVVEKQTQVGPGLKLCIKFFGIYQVMGIKNHDRYEVEKITDEKWETRITCSVNKMKPLKGFRYDLQDNCNKDDELTAKQQTEADIELKNEKTEQLNLEVIQNCSC